jgi:hypothetical protein
MSMRHCDIEGCESKTVARGLCNKHYRRLKRYGDPTAPATHQEMVEQAVESWDRSECWIAPAETLTRTGYGMIQVNGRKMPVSRYALVLDTGDDGEGLEAAHKPVVCHNRACFNPDHLEFKTPEQNAADRIADGTHGKKLNSADALAIYAAKGLESANVLAERYGVGAAQVRGIWAGRKWSQVTGEGK